MDKISKIPILYIECSFFVHATEDLEKVVKAAQNILPGKFLDKIIFKQDRLRGYHGNPIIFFKSKIRKKPVIQAFIQTIALKLSVDEKKKLLAEIENHVDEDGNMYLRLDKQASCMGKFKLGQADPIRIKIRFLLRDKSMENLIQTFERLGILS